MEIVVQVKELADRELYRNRHTFVFHGNVALLGRSGFIQCGSDTVLSRVTAKSKRFHEFGGKLEGNPFQRKTLSIRFL